MEKERVSVVVTEDTARRAVSGMIQENGGYLPVEWFQFAEKPHARQKDAIFR